MFIKFLIAVSFSFNERFESFKRSDYTFKACIFGDGEQREKKEEIQKVEKTSPIIVFDLT